MSASIKHATRALLAGLLLREGLSGVLIALACAAVWYPLRCRYPGRYYASGDASCTAAHVSHMRAQTEGGNQHECPFQHAPLDSRLQRLLGCSEIACLEASQRMT
jgi:hypothetical protein